MPWRPLPKIAFAIATHPFEPSSSEDLPLELGDELYIIEEGGKDFLWLRGYLVAPPSILAGLTSVKGRTLEARVFSGIFPRACVTIREYLDNSNGEAVAEDASTIKSAHAPKSLTSENDEEAEEEDDEDDDVSIGPDESASQISISENSKNGIVRVKKRTPKTTTIKPLSQTTREIESAATTPTSIARTGKPPAPVPMLKIGDNSPASQAEPLIDEIASCLREWYSTNLHELTLSRRYTEIEKLSKLQRKLDSARRQMQTSSLTDHELKAVRERTVWNLVKGNKMLSSEVIVRDPSQGGRLLTGNDDALHVASLQAQMSLLKKPIPQLSDGVSYHHILFELKDINAVTKNNLSFYVALYTKEGSNTARPLTEPFQVDLPAGSLVKTTAVSKLRTLFSGLGTSDVGETKPFGTKIYIVIKAQSRFSIQEVNPQSTATIDADDLEPRSPTDESLALKTRRSLMFGSIGLSGAKGKMQSSLVDGIDSADTPTEMVTPTLPKNFDLRPTNVKTKFYSHDVGYAVVELKDVSELVAGMEKSIDLWCPATSENEVVHHTGSNTDLLFELFGSSSGYWTRSKDVSRIQFRSQAFLHQDAQELIRANPTILHDTVCSQKIGFAGVPDKPRSDIFLTISEAFVPPNAMFSHPTRGAVPMEGLEDYSSLVMTIEVKTNDGQWMVDCIKDASNSPAMSSWQSSAVSRGTNWSQTLKLQIPKEQVMECHIVMTLSDSSDIPCGLGYIPLWQDGAFIPDGLHRALIYQNDRVITRVMGERLAYTNLSWEPKARDNRQSWSHNMATFNVRTDLVSTFFSQNQVLLNVLNWKDQTDEQLIQALQRLRNVPDLELVKFISEILDALFGILVQRSGNDDFEDVIFSSVVDILTIAQSKRFNLAPIIDNYTDSRFQFPFAAPCLMRSYLRLILRRSDERNSRRLRATLKVGRQLLKFILNARRQQIQKEEYIGINNSHDGAFLREIQKLFLSLEDQMRDSTPAAIGNKTLLVQHVHTWLPELLTSFGEAETAALAMSFLDACSHVSGKLILHKLVFIWNLVKLSEQWNPRIREKINLEAEAWISHYWGTTVEPDEQYREQVRLCVSIVALRNGDYGTRTFPLYEKVLESFHCVASMPAEKPGSFSLLFPTMYPFPSRPTESERNYDECLIELSALKATFNPDAFKQFRSETQDRLDVITTSLAVDVMILQERAFPKSWITLHAFHHRVIMGLLELFTELAPASNFIPPPEESESFNLDLWRSFLDTLLVVVRSDALALESLPEQRRKAVWNIVGDLRGTGASLLSQNWHALGWPAEEEEQAKYSLSRLGGYQVQYVPSLVGPIVELCLSIHEGLRNAAVEVLRTMIIAEYDLNGDISVIQTEMIRTLDELFKNKNIADITQQKLFIDQLMDGFKNLQGSEDDGIWEVCHNLVLAIDELLDLLVAAHAPDQHESLAIINTLALLDFLRGMQKDDIFIDYAHQLAEVEAKDRHYQEAGLALKLHADLYEWNPDTKVEELRVPAMPAQTMFERKEEIYMQMIEYFEKGNAWGAALDCYIELAHQYQHTIFNFTKLAKAQHSMARTNEAIAKGQGEVSRYFQVNFTGLGFPPSLKDKSFVYEGLGTERLTSFNDRLQKQYPMAKLLDSTAPDDVEEAEGQYIKVGIIQVHNDLNQVILRRSRVALSAKEYVLTHRPQFFSTTIKKYPGIDVGDSESDKMVLETAEPFPTILRRSLVVSQQVIRLSSIETAIERVLRKTFELRHLSKRVAEEAPGSLKVLADAIKSQVDPVSKASVTIYRPLLRRYQAEHVDSEQRVRNYGIALETTMLDFASLLRDTIPKLDNDKHGLEFKNSTILFRSTFEPELITIAQMAPPARPVTEEFKQVEQDAYSSAISATPSQSLANGHHDINGSEMAQGKPAESKRFSFLRRSVDTDDKRRQSRLAVFDGEAPGPSVPTSRQSPSRDGLERPPQSRASARMAEPTLTRSSSKSRAQRRQSWRTTSEATIDGSNASGSTPKRSTSRANEAVAQAVVSRTEEEPFERPRTNHSVGQSFAPSVRSATGSIRKRLSVFGISKKATKILGVQDRVKEEE